MSERYASHMEHADDDTARFERIREEFARGFSFIQRFEHKRVVTVYGASRIKEGHPLYEEARKFGRLCAEQGLAVVTGGGPGIMEAANRGAYEAGGESAGICIQLPGDTEKRNTFLRESASFYYFFVRKMLLAHVAQAYVFFPGGFGTLDEFFEISTLIETHKLHHDVPVVLVEDDYWKPLRQWLDTMLTDRFHTLYDRELNIWQIVDTAEAALKIVEKIPMHFPRDPSLGGGHK